MMSPPLTLRSGSHLVVFGSSRYSCTSMITGLLRQGRGGMGGGRAAGARAMRRDGGVRRPNGHTRKGKAVKRGGGESVVLLMRF
ncbi:hypothetical protein L209DRAFT_135235 [Thermothelomyces heterothallicus CBS 203.75]